MENIKHAGDLKKEVAEKLVELLLDVCDGLDRAARLVDSEMSSELAEEFKPRIANAMTAVGWDILECLIYQRFSELRPYSIEGQEEAKKEDLGEDENS